MMPVARSVAVIVVVPAETAVAKPFDPVTLLITATAVLEEAQETSDVMSRVPVGAQIVGVAAE